MGLNDAGINPTRWQIINTQKVVFTKYFIQASPFYVKRHLLQATNKLDKLLKKPIKMPFYKGKFHKDYL